MKTCPEILLVTLLFLVFLLTVPVYAADPPALEWQTVLGGGGNDYSHSVDQTSDGGYIVTGMIVRSGSNTEDSADTDVWVVRLDPLGSLLWQKAFGEADADGGASIQQTTDGGYVLVGFTTVNRYHERYVPSTTVSRYSDSYHENNVRYPEYSTGYTDYRQGNGIYTVRAVSNYVTAQTPTRYTEYTTVSRDRDVWVIQLDPAGNLQWQKVLGGYGNDEGFDIQQTADGGSILTGSTYSSDSGDVGTNHGASDFWVVKLSPSGNLQWQKLLGGYAADVGYSIRQTPDGGSILTGQTASDNSGNVGTNHGDMDVWVVKLDPAGNLQWQKTYGGSAADVAYCIRPTSDGGYVFTGGISSAGSGDVAPNHGSVDLWVVKLDSSGNIGWQKVLGGTSGDQGFSIRQTVDGGYVLTGYAASGNSGDVGLNHGSGDLWVVKLDPSGNVQWQKLLGGNLNEQGWGIQQTKDGGFILTGNAQSSNNGDVGTNHGLYDFWVVRLSMDSSASPVPTTPILSAGQASATYQVGFDGLSYNADGKQTLDLDLAKARRSRATVAVYTDRVEIYQQAPDGVLVTFRGRSFALQGDRITGPVQSADLVTDPVQAPLTPGIVSGSVRATIPELTRQGTFNTTINDTVAPALADQFRGVLLRNGLEFGTVAYAYDVRKSNLPATGGAWVNLSLPAPWVDLHGGAGAVRIIRVSDTTGAAELLPVTVVGTDKKGMMYFEGVSINGTSVFGLITLKASQIAQAEDPGRTIVPLQQPALMTILGMVSWLAASLQQNPAGALAVVASAGAAYAGRKRGMW